MYDFHDLRFMSQAAKMANGDMPVPTFDDEDEEFDPLNWRSKARRGFSEEDDE